MAVKWYVLKWVDKLGNKWTTGPVTYADGTERRIKKAGHLISKKEIKPGW